MKNKFPSLIPSVVLAGLIALGSTHAEMNHDAHAENHEHQKMEHHKGHSKHHGEKMDAEMKKHVNSIYDSYLNISKNLAADDFAKAQAGVNELNQEMAAAPAKCEMHENKGHHSNMIALAQEMSAAKDIEGLRNSFQKFSEAFIKNFKGHSDALDKDFKVFYCPMKKGHWAQDQAGTKNPYYGASMLACGGEVK